MARVCPQSGCPTNCPAKPFHGAPLSAARQKLTARLEYAPTMSRRPGAPPDTTWPPRPAQAACLMGTASADKSVAFGATTVSKPLCTVAVILSITTVSGSSIRRDNSSLRNSDQRVLSSFDVPCSLRSTLCCALTISSRGVAVTATSLASNPATAISRVNAVSLYLQFSCRQAERSLPRPASHRAHRQHLTRAPQRSRKRVCGCCPSTARPR